MVYLAAVLGLTIALRHWGLDISPHAKLPAFADVLAYVLATTTVLARPENSLSLSTLGSFIQVAARIVGPACFGLALLALRARVKR